MKKNKALVWGGVSLLASPLFLLAQIPVTDGAANLKLIQEGITLAQQLGVMNGIHNVSAMQEVWLAQVVLNKLPWGVQYPAHPQTSTATNTMGEMATWSPVLATGLGGGRTAWIAASQQLASLAPVLINQQIGSPMVAQLASKEAIDAAGANNLEIVGTARQYISSTAPAWNALQSQLLDPRRASSGPTQDLQYAAAGIAQNEGTAVQSLQVNTGILETATAVSKGLSDVDAYDLDLQAKQQQTYLTQPAAPLGMGSAFAAAGVVCNVGCP